jgi:hypothetical protein
MGLRMTQFIAIILTALALVPAGAHLLELVHKITLDRAQYLTVQQLYRGWALLGAVLIAALLANLVLTVRSRRKGWPMRLAAIATLLLAANLTVFFIWTFPANQATGNWTVLPADWEALRNQWEYSHAVNALLTFLALAASVASSLSWPAASRD